MIVYKVTNKTNGKFYIGQTIRPMSVRWNQHRSQKNGALYNAISKYGEDVFLVEVVCECKSIDDLNYCEDFIIRYNIKMGHTLYNRTLGGGFNMRHTEETKRIIREGQMGKKNQFYGKTHTEETKRAIGDKHRGKTLSSCHKKRLLEGASKPKTKEHRDRIADSHLKSYRIHFDDGSFRDYIKTNQNDIAKEFGTDRTSLSLFMKVEKVGRKSGIRKVEILEI